MIYQYLPWTKTNDFLRVGCPLNMYWTSQLASHADATRDEAQKNVCNGGYLVAYVKTSDIFLLPRNAPIHRFVSGLFVWNVSVDIANCEFSFLYL